MFSDDGANHQRTHNMKPFTSLGRLAPCIIASTLAVLLVACGGGGSAPLPVPNPPLVFVPASELPGSGGARPAEPAPEQRPSASDAARFLTQASFGIQSAAQIADSQKKGHALWLWEQFNTGTTLQVSYVDQQQWRNMNAQGKPRPDEEMSYEAIWQQWLYGPDQLRGRMAFALGQIMVISNVAPDIRPHAMSSYMDLLNRNAFGNYCQLLKDVTLHPAMGYYLNMINSEKDDPKTGAHPNENYAREVLQLFSIGLVKLNIDGSTQLDAQSKTIPTYDEAVVQGFAKAFTGWTYPNATAWNKADENVPAAWTSAMKPFASRHSQGAKQIFDGAQIADGQTIQKDMDDAMAAICAHPNMAPFISRQLIQRLVTSNPSKTYIGDVAKVFNDNGQGAKGDLRAVLSAILLHPEARSAVPAANFGKQREPVIRFANFLRALDAKSPSGRNAIHYLESADNGLGQSPLLSPSVFNFFLPNFRPAGKIAQAGLVAPEFQITTETTVVGGLNFFANLVKNKSYGNGDTKLSLNVAPLEAAAGNTDQLIGELNALFYNYQMSAKMQARMRKMLNGFDDADKAGRVRAALILTSLSPEFVVQK
jgi:uncharacterized protein (DUF1800 family)